MIQNERVPTVLLLRKQLFHAFAHDEYSSKCAALFCKTLTRNLMSNNIFTVSTKSTAEEIAINTT
jgi:hypothetical protein